MTPYIINEKQKTVVQFIFMFWPDLCSKIRFVLFETKTCKQTMVRVAYPKYYNNTLKYMADSCRQHPALVCMTLICSTVLLVEGPHSLQKILISP